MFERNELTNVIQCLNVTENLEQEITNFAKNIGRKIHSLIVYNVYDEQNLEGWEIRYNVSQTNKFNTIKTDDAVTFICENICKNSTEFKYVNCYMQPNVELIIKLRKYLILKLAKEQKQRWNWLELEDLIQMCNLVICDLYYKGYYIHDRLIRRAYANYVLLHIRKDKCKPVIVSLEQNCGVSDDDKSLTIKDMIADTKFMQEQDDKDDAEVHHRILLETKDIVIDFIGPRQYDQLLREYKNKQTTAWSRKLMQTIKAHLFEMGISKKSFNKYYE